MGAAMFQFLEGKIFWNEAVSRKQPSLVTSQSAVVVAVIWKFPHYKDIRIFMLPAFTLKNINLVYESHPLPRVQIMPGLKKCKIVQMQKF